MQSTIHEGHLVASDLRFGLVVSRWNAFITEKMLEGARDAITRHGPKPGLVTTARVPGTW